MNKVLVGCMMVAGLSGCVSGTWWFGGEHASKGELPSQGKIVYVQKNVPPAKKFLREYVGATIGDDISSYPKEGVLGSRELPLLKRTKYLNRACGRFVNGKLHTIMLFPDPVDALSEDEAKEYSTLLLDDVYEQMGVTTADARADKAYSVGPMIIRDGNRKVSDVGVYIRKSESGFGD